MSSKRKHLALVVACCLAVTTVLPGFSYAASTPEETLPVESTAAIPEEEESTAESVQESTQTPAGESSEESLPENTEASTETPEPTTSFSSQESLNPSNSIEENTLPQENSNESLDSTQAEESSPSLEEVQANAEGEGPQVTDVRIITERNYLEIRWDREVENSIDPSNYVLKNGDQEFRLLTGNRNSMYFEGYAFSSIGFNGTVDDSQTITLEIVEGNTIQDADGNKAEAQKLNVDYESYYTQSYTSKVGIEVISSDNVKESSLEIAASQIDHMLSAPGAKGIVDELVENGAALALYGPDENAYFIPEHRNAWDPEMYYVEGYGGSMYNDCVSSIAEKNVIRVLEDPIEANNTSYRNENILIHEFGHSVKLCGMDMMEDQSLHDEFMALYNSRKRQGRWPNSYAIGNSDEFFATMCTIWFSVMSESKDGSWDGVRGPVNTREELKLYDPETYEFFAKIFPEEFLEDPWNPTGTPGIPDDFEATEFVPAEVEEGSHDYAADTFKILRDGDNGTEYHLEQYNGVVLWWNYGDEDINSWKLTRTADGFHITTLDGSQALAPTDGSTVALADADITDPSQLWNFVPMEGTTGKLVNVGSGQALGVAGKDADGTALQLVDEADAPGWRIDNLTKDAPLVPKASHDFANTYFKVSSSASGAVWENYNGGVIWSTTDSSRNSWKIEIAGEGYFRLIPMDNPDMVLAPQNSGTTAGTRVLITARDDADPTQLWRLEDADGALRFVNKASGLAIGLKDNSTENDTQMVLAEVDEESIYQQWDVTNKTTSAALSQPDIPNYVANVEKTVTVESVRLIEEDYVEIIWSENVSESTLPENYKITINGQEVAIDPGRSFYYRQMTSLGLADPLEDPENATGTLEILGNIGNAKVEQTTYEFQYVPYYTQFVTSESGIVVKANDKVQKSTLELTAKTIDFMLSKRPEIAAEMVENGADVAIYSYPEENAYYLPEFRIQTDPNVSPALGLGGNMQLNTSSFAESTVLGHGENVLVHEFGHAIKALGISQLADQSLIREYEEAYIHANLSGLWPDTYAISNAEEFFASVSTVWFECGYETDMNWGGTAGPVNTKEDLKMYDPQTYEFFSKIYPDEHLPEDCWDYSSLENKYPITETPDTVEPEPPVDPDDAGLPPEDYDLDQHYFKIYSYLGTNVIDHDPAGSETAVNTWWDYSNSGYNYNFDGLSWKVEKVGDYYRFIHKVDGRVLMPENSGTEIGTPIIAGELDENDDTQLWQLVRVEGYFCQLVNKASGLVLGTQNHALPADGTLLELTAYTKEPSYSQQWRVIRLKDNPGDPNLMDDHYAIRPLRMDYSALETAGEKALALDRSLYTAESLEALDAAMAGYANAMENGLAPQEWIDNMAAGIQTALDALVLQGSTDPTDPTDPTTPSEPGTVTYTPSITLKLNGTQPAQAETFRFHLEAASSNPEGAVLGSTTAVLKGSGTASFGPITFHKAGEYRFTIWQEAGKTDGVVYDGRVWTLTVTVAEKDGVLSISQVLYEPDTHLANSTAAAFTNQYQTSSTVKTGDDTHLLAMAAVMASAAAAAIWLTVKRSKCRREE